MTELLTTSSLRHTYNGAKQWLFPDFVLEEGGRLLLWGESGSGKTTLLHLLAGLLRPKGGSITFDGADWSGMNAADQDRLRGTAMGMVFQRPHFISALSAKENITLTDRLLRRPADDQWLEQLTTRLQIAPLMDKATYALSEGEKQRVGIARALYHRPKLVLADEPTSALDAKNADAVLTLLQELADTAGAAIVAVTHDRRIKGHFTDILSIDAV